MFKLYTKKPNAIKYGKLYTTELPVNFDDKPRTVRVWVPENYNSEKKDEIYKVIYMADGQNIVDKYTTAFGEWNFDEVVHALIKKGYEGLVVVGIDSPRDDNKRSNELCSPIRTRYHKEGDPDPIGNQFVDFVFDVVKPLVEANFNVSSKKEDVGVGGSSMGGLYAFYAYCYRHKDIGYSLSFSPAFFLYKRPDFIKGLHAFKPDPKEYGKLFFMVGGLNFEGLFYKDTFITYDYLRRRGFKEGQLGIIFDSNKDHSEKSWNSYLDKALEFWLVKK